MSKNNTPRAALAQRTRKPARWLAAAALAGLGLCAAQAQKARPAPKPATRAAAAKRTMPGPLPGGALLLPNGWRLSPAGRLVALPGDMPMQMTLAPGGRYLIVNTGGFHNHTVNVIDTQTGALVQSVDVGKDWDGLALDATGGAVYVSGGGAPSSEFLAGAKKAGATPAQLAAFDKPLLRLALANGKLSAATGVEVAGMDAAAHFTAGLAAGRGGALFVLDAPGNTLYKMSGTPLATTGFVPTGYGPSRVALSPDGSVVAVSNEGDQSVSLYNADTLDALGTVPVGIHPHALAYGRDGRLYVANAGSSTVSVIQNGLVRETVGVAPDPAQPSGSTPDALAVSPDGARVYVANAGNNDVAVLDTSNPAETKVVGLIPTAWYPTALALSPDGATLYVGTAKGAQSRANIPAQTPAPNTQHGHGPQYDYVGNILTGHIAIVPVPDAAALAAYTKQVVANTPTLAHALLGHEARLADAAFDAFKHITHVLFIIRENRTYDQIMGDVKQGNGDPTLTLFGEKTTPNAHALARRTVLLDNLYCNGEVSEDGHQWCDSANASDYVERSWPSKYGGRGEPVSDARLTDAPAGYLWDECRDAGLSYYSYGETDQSKAAPGDPPLAESTGTGSLAGHLSPTWAAIPFGQHDTEKAAVFLADLKRAEASGQWPSFQVMSLSEDHTQGLKAGTYTPAAHVAANDLALGQIVQGVSQSRFWRSTAIFVIEDDAQDGPDHVDCHRTVGLLVSPYARRGVKDSTFYTTASMVRTMQLILHLPALTQYDQAAPPLYGAFTNVPDFAPILALPPRIDINARNPATGPGAEASARLDLSAPDRADPAALNAILWHALRPGAPLPAPRGVSGERDKD